MKFSLVKLHTLKLFALVAALLFAFALSTTTAFAQANPQMNYQGKLTNASGVAVPDGTYNMRFWLIDSGTAATSTALWTESLTGTERVQVTNGLFSVMLGSSSALTGVDFNQTLYLGVEIGGTGGSPAWDGEMSPRKILGTVPAAFVATTAITASSANSLSGIASSSFLRSDEADTMTASSSSALLTLIQNGVGKVLSLFSGATEIFTALSNGNIGVGTTTPAMKFSVNGGSLADFFRAASTTAASTFMGPVGLGTTTPEQQLVVQGRTQFWEVGGESPAIDIDGTLGINTAIDFFSAGVQTARMRAVTGGFEIEDNGATRFYITDGGSVQLNDASGGTALTVTNIGNVDVANDLTVTKDFVVTGTSTLATTTISSLTLGSALGATSGGTGLSTIAQNQLLIGGPGNTWTQIATSALGLASTLSGGTNGFLARWTSDSALSTGLFRDNGTVAGVNATSSSYTFNVQGSAGTNAFNVASSSGTSIFAVTSNSRVGIGSTTPSHTLSVNGTAAVANFIAASTTAISTIANQLDIGVTNLSHGNAGALNIRSLGSNTNIGLKNDSMGEASISFNVLVYGLSFDTHDDLPITFRPNNSTAMTMIGDGRVGIGTSTLNSTRLTIDGGMSLSGALLDSTRATGTLGMVLQTTGTSTRWVATSTLGLGISGGTNGFLARWTGDSTIGTGLFRDNGTVAGVNATSSSYTFNVQGTSGVNPFNVASSTGTSLFTILNSGNVGVGTTSPAAKFSVSGLALADNFRAASTTADSLFGGTVTIGSGSGLISKLNVFGDGTNTPAEFETSQAGLATVLTLSNSNGGGNAAALDFDVTGTTRAQIYSYDSALVFETSQANSMMFNINGSSNTAMVIDTNLNVGIGSTSPSSRLTVGGNTYIGGNLRLTGAFLDSTSATGTLGMVLQTTGTSTRWVATSTLGLSGITGSGSTGQLAKFTAAGAVGNSVLYEANGSIGLGGAPTFSGAIEAGGDYDSILDGSITIYNPNGGAGAAASLNFYNNTGRIGSLMAVGHGNTWDSNIHRNRLRLNAENAAGMSIEAEDAAGSISFYTGASARERLYIAASGNIAVGTTSPWAKLSVQNAYGSTTALFDIATTTSAAYATSSLFKVLASGNVGIGNTSPSYKLHVGPAYSSSLSETQAMFSRSGGSAISVVNTAASVEAFLLANTSLVEIGSMSDTPIIFSVGNDAKAIITTAGNLGIGTSTPYAKLTVAGGLGLTGAFLDSTAATGTLGMVLQTTGTSTRWVATSTLGISAGASTFLALTDTPSSYTANRVLFTNSGATAVTDSANFVFDGTNLGIGTTSPAARLGVNGLALADYFRAASTTATSSFDGNAVFTKAAALFGFGTSTPVSQFTINGNRSNSTDNSSLTTGSETFGIYNNNTRLFAIGTTLGGDAMVEVAGADGVLVTKRVLGAGGDLNLVPGGSSNAVNIRDSNNSTPNAQFLSNGRISFGTTSSSVASLFLQSKASMNPFAIASSTGVSLLTLTQAGDLGIGTTSPAAKLGVNGIVLADRFIAASTTATSTFANGIQLLGGCFRDANATSTCIGRGQSATYVVAASNSKNKIYADYIADGTGDQVEINAAIAAAYTASRGAGGKVYLLEGDYSVSSSTYMATGTQLIGSGPGTILKLANSTNAAVNMISIVGQTGLRMSGVTISDLTIDGNRANQASGGQVGIQGTYVATSTIQRVAIRNTRSSGIMFDYSNSITIDSNTLENVSIDTQYYIGIELYSDNSSYPSYGHSVTNNKLVNAGGANGYSVLLYNTNTSVVSGNVLVVDGAVNIESGIEVHTTSIGDYSYGNTISNNSITGYPNNGISLYDESSTYTVHNNTISNNTIADSKIGIYLISYASNNTVTGNTIYATADSGIVLNASDDNLIGNNVITDNGGTGTQDAIVIANSDRNLISSNRIDTVVNQAIEIDSSSLNNTLVGNYYTNTAATAVNDAGLGTRYTQWDRLTLDTRPFGSVGYSLLSIYASSSIALASTTQMGTGKILSLNNSAGEMFTVANGGNVGIGTSTPYAKLTVAGGLGLTGAFLDSTSATGTLGMVLQTTGTSTRWVATSTLGITSALSGGTNGFLARWTSDSVLGSGLFRDNGTVAGVNATSSSYTFNVQGSGGVNAFNVASSSGTSILAVTSNSRVGIGSTTPSHTLSVNGTAGVSTFVAASTTGISTVANRLDIGSYSGTVSNTSALNIVGEGSAGLTFDNASMGEAGLFYNNSTYGLTLETIASQVITIRPNSTYGAYFDTNGNTGLGTSTLRNTRLTIDGGMSLSGALLDSTRATGTLGMVLQSTGTSTRWVATSTLGITGGGGITGSGSTGQLAKFTGTGSVGDSVLYEANSSIGLGAAPTITGGFEVNGSYDSFLDGSFTITNTNAGAGAAASINLYNSTGRVGSLLGIGDTNTWDGGLHQNRLYLNAEQPEGMTIQAEDAAGSISFYTGASVNERLYIAASGNISVGTTSPWAKLSIQNAYGSTTALLDIATTTSASYATSSLFKVLSNGNVGVGTTTPTAKFAVNGLVLADHFRGASTTATSTLAAALGIGTSSPFARGLTIDRSAVNGTSTAGIGQYLAFANTSAGAQQFGNNTYIRTTNTATTTLVGNILRLEDSTTYGNTVRGFEVQTERGTNTLGENTAISGFARTFGVRGVTEGDAGGTYEPAGVYGETRGTTQGNAIRGYSSTITTAALLKLFQDTSTFTGTGLLMNFGNSGGSFSSTTASRFIDLQNAGTSRFTVGAYGMLTIGDGTTGTNAGIQIGYGGLCVDNDGSCNASTTGRISSVSTATGNSDLAEMYFSNDGLEPGEVVYLKGGLSVGRASESTKDLVIGVVSTLPGLVMGQDDVSLRPGEEAHPIALKGRVPVKVSNENGAVKKGDELMLSGVPGVVMKASSTGTVVGIALEDYEDTRAYSDTFINQFGESIIVPDYTPINRVSDPRINDGCYYGGGSEAGDAPCVPLVATTSDAQYDEADALALAESKERALRALARESSDQATTEAGETVRVGQIVMFVDLRYRYLDTDGETMLAALSAQVGDSATDTVWNRLVDLAHNFVDGVLSVLTLKADRVETNELCVDGVCVTADDLRTLLENETNVPEDEPQPPVEEEGDEIVEDGEGDTTPPPVIEETPPPTEEDTGAVVEEGTGGGTSTEEVVPEPVPEPEPQPESPQEETPPVPTPTEPAP